MELILEGRRKRYKDTTLRLMFILYRRSSSRDAIGKSDQSLQKQKLVV